MKKNILLKKIAITVFSTLIFIVCVKYVIINFEWSKIIQLLKDTNFIYFFWGCSCTIIVYWFLRSLRWFFILRNLQIKINFFKLYIWSAMSLSLSIVTPLQFGEILKIEFLKKNSSISRIQGYSAFMFERFIDLSIIVMLSAVSLILLFESGGLFSYLIIFFMIIIVFFIGFYFIYKRQFKGKVGEILSYLKTCGSNIGNLIIVILLTLFSWFVVAAGWQIALSSISVYLSFEDSISLMSIITLASIISFIPGGLGVSEVGVTEFLLHLGESSSLAQTGGLILRAYGFLILFLGLVHFFAWTILHYGLNFERKKK